MGRRSERAGCAPLRRWASLNERRYAISTKLFVGNLSFGTTKNELTELFSQAGDIVDVFLPTDRATGRPRGFAFVEFATQEAATAAIAKFNGHELGGRALRVNEAEDRPRRSGPPSSFSDPGFFGGGGGGFGGGGGGRRAKPKGSRRNIRGRKRSL